MGEVAFREEARVQCPNCGLFNPETALRCDCGFDFPSGRMKGSLLSSQELRMASEARSTGYAPFWWMRFLMKVLSAAHDRWSGEGRRRRSMQEAYRKISQGQDTVDSR